MKNAIKLFKGLRIDFGRLFGLIDENNQRKTVVET